MKKNILNRAMFRQVKSPAYGTGISANLVSDEQRQKYNYGGRVRAGSGVYSGGPVYMGKRGDEVPQWWDQSWGPIVQQGERGLMWDPYAGEEISYSTRGTGPAEVTEHEGYEGAYVPGEGIYKVSGERGPKIISGKTDLGLEKIDYIPTTHAEMKELSETYQPWKGRLPNIENIDEAYMKAQAGSKRDALERSMGYGFETPVKGKFEGKKFKGKSYGMIEPDPEGVDRDFGPLRKKIIFGKEDYAKQLLNRDDKSDVLDLLDEQETEIGNYPQDGDVIKKKLKVDTDVKPTPAAEEDIFAFLDESIEKKKKLGRGKGLMDAAAAAIKWGHAPTAEKRGAAIAEGLTKMGEAGTKFAGEAMDLKDRAKILAAIEDKKGATKIAVQKSKNEYGMALNIKAYELAGFNKKESQAQALKDNITFAEYSKGTRKEQQDRFFY